MSDRKITFIVGEYYHLYNRGNSKQVIFIDDQDRDRFVKLLYLCNSVRSFNFREDIVKQKIDAFDFDRGDVLVSIGAWVLMPNHFHLYVTPSPRQPLGRTEENVVAVFMGKLCTSYSMYFNKKYGRTGKLFEGVFKSVHIEDDEQAKYLFSYIHLNPIKLVDKMWKENGIKNFKKSLEFLNRYKWGSFLDFRGVKRSENQIISQKDFPEYFTNRKVFDREIFDWLDYDDENKPPALGVA